MFTINPQFTREQVSFTLSVPAHVRVRIAPTGQLTNVRTIDLGLQPAGTVQLTWDGRDNAQRLVPEGPYTYTFTATDDQGEQRSESYGMLGITYRRIVVSLSKERLWAYDGSQEVLTTLVTTGNAALPTPLGQFPILARYSPFTMVSPWPPSSPYHYDPTRVTYALLFDDRGYDVHDAPWRSNFGPGSNATSGTPGQASTGTHGCVNVPYPVMQQLFEWATIGTVVDVAP